MLQHVAVIKLWQEEHVRSSVEKQFLVQNVNGLLQLELKGIEHIEDCRITMENGVNDRML